MTQGRKFIFAIDAIGRNGKRFFGEVMLLFVSLLMLSIAFFLNIQSHYSKIILEQVLKKKPEMVGTLMVDNFYTKEALSFYKEALNSKKIDSIGPLGTGGTAIIPELYQIQEGHQQGFCDSNYENMVEFHYVKQGIFSLCNVFLEKGKFLTEEELKKKNVIGLYLGYAYKDIPVGTTYQYKPSKGECMNFEVLGILKKHSRFVGTQVFVGSNVWKTKLYDNLDYAAFMVQPNITDAMWLFDVNSSYSFEEGKEKLEELAKKHKVDIQIGNMGVDIKHGERDSKNFQNLMMELFFLLGTTTVICLLSFQIMSIWKRESEYGILYAVGAGTKDIISIIVWENVIKLIAAFLLMVIVSILFVKYYVGGTSEEVSLMIDILSQHVYGKTALIGVGMVALGIVFPIIKLSKKSPVQLIFQS